MNHSQVSNIAFDRERIRSAVLGLAKQGVFIGTSSWKYSGWRGQLYTDDRYVWRGRFSEKRFEELCLTEYSEVFKTVCVDAAYYKFPDREYIQGLVEAVPDDFLFGFKVTDEITIKQFPNLPRFGRRAGKRNESFLKADLFESEFLKPCEPFKKNIGVLLFEFSKFYSSDYETGRHFASELESFLSRIPKGWPYAVEIRNRHFLHADYFASLHRQGVAHVFNSWAEMPSVSEQLGFEGSRTVPQFTPARFLLTPGRKYEDAVKLFSPYDRIRQPDTNARRAAARLLSESNTETPNRRTFLFVNNRLEGNALQTIAAMIEQQQ
jgi:uncharacterized protein YecE (DUF72 family)